MHSFPDPTAHYPTLGFVARFVVADADDVRRTIRGFWREADLLRVKDDPDARPILAEVSVSEVDAVAAHLPHGQWDMVVVDGEAPVFPGRHPHVQVLEMARYVNRHADVVTVEVTFAAGHGYDRTTYPFGVTVPAQGDEDDEDEQADAGVY